MKEIQNKMNIVYELCEKINNEKIIVLAKFLKSRINNPDSFVVFLGETSSGKTTILNGLLQEQLLYTSATPSTGSIVEIMFDKDEANHSYYAINKNATMEELSYETFDKLIKKPDNNLQRLRLKTKVVNDNFNGLRIFDTPGYNSIVTEHEEILKEFLPNSDVITYIVNYKIGIQQEDFNFLLFLKEICNDTVLINIAINMVPEGVNDNDRRIKEILNYAKDILNYDPKYFLLPKITVENDEAVLPKCDDLWDYISSEINSDERQNILKENFNGFIVDLFHTCEREVNKKYQQLKLSLEEKENIQQQVSEFLSKKDKAMELIDTTFSRVERNTKSRLETLKSNVVNKLCNDIDSKNVMKMDETITYVNTHLLPFTIKKELEDVQNYIRIELEALDKELENYLNQEINHFIANVEVVFSTFTDQAQKAALKNIANNLIGETLSKYFIMYGGRGGFKAGVANAASKLLKQVGKLFNKTFSSATHNGLKQFIAKIGANSAKAVGAAIAVVIEITFIVIEYSTWKMKLKQKVKSGVDKWYEDAYPTTIKDLEKLKEENINTISGIFTEFAEQFTYDTEPISKEEEESIMSLLEYTKITKNKIGVIEDYE